MLATTVLSPPPVIWVAVAFFGLIGLAGTYKLPSAWSGRNPWIHQRKAPRWWRWGEPLWRGRRRSIVLLIISADTFVAAIVVGALTPEHSSVSWICPALFLIFLLTIFVLTPTVILLARPRFLIPPPLRGESGAISDWLVARRRRGGAPPTSAAPR